MDPPSTTCSLRIRTCASRRTPLSVVRQAVWNLRSSSARYLPPVRRGHGPRGCSRAGASMPTRREPVWRHGRGVGGPRREPGPRPAGRGGWAPSIAHRPHHQEGALLRPARRDRPRQPSPERARTVAPAQQTPAPRAADLRPARPPGQAEEQDPSDPRTPDQKETLMRTRMLAVVSLTLRGRTALRALPVHARVDAED